MFIEKWYKQEEQIDKTRLNEYNSAMFKKTERYIYFSWLGKIRKKLCLQKIYKQLSDAQDMGGAVENYTDASMKQLCDSIIKEQREKGFDFYHLLYGIQYGCLLIVLLPLVALLIKGLFNCFRFETIKFNLNDSIVFLLIAIITLIFSTLDKKKIFANWVEVRKITINKITLFMMWIISSMEIINWSEKLISGNILNKIFFIYPSFWIIMSCIVIFATIEFYLYNYLLIWRRYH